MWARSIVTRTGGMGMLRVSSAARCLRPRSSRLAAAAAPPAPARGGRAVLEAAFLTAGAVIGPPGAGVGLGGCQVDPAPPTSGEDAVGFAQGDRLGGAQRRVVQAAEERFHVLAARPLSPDRFQERAGLGGAGDGPAVD